jgi:hypothetical protein
MRSAIVVVLASLTLAAPSAAQALVPFGPEFLVNTTTTSFQDNGWVAWSGNEFVVVWSSVDGDGTGIWARRFSAAGAPLTGEVRVNTYTTGNQTFPVVAGSSANGFVVAWESAGNASTDNIGTSVTAQRYGADGAPAGPEFQVNTYTTQNQKFPRIGMDFGSGSFVIAWHSQNQIAADSGYDVIARRFDANGGSQGGEFRVNSYTTGLQRANSVAVGANQFVVVWDGNVWDGAVTDDPDGVAAKVYSSLGNAVSGDVVVNTYTTNTQGNASAAMLPTGEFLVTWSSSLEDGSANGVIARRFSSAGIPQGAAFRLNASTTNAQSGPVAATDGSRFVVVWRSSQVSANGYDGIAHTVTLGGQTLGGELLVNTYTTGAQQNQRVAAGPAGRFVVTWDSLNQESPTSATDVRARLLAPSGDVNGSGVVDVADVFYLINRLFAGGAAPLGPSDPNHDGDTNVNDVFYLINFLFAGGSAPV